MDAVGVRSRGWDSKLSLSIGRIFYFYKSESWFHVKIPKSINILQLRLRSQDKSVAIHQQIWSNFLLRRRPSMIGRKKKVFSACSQIVAKKATAAISTFSRTGFNKNYPILLAIKVQRSHFYESPVLFLLEHDSTLGKHLKRLLGKIFFVLCFSQNRNLYIYLLLCTFDAKRGHFLANYYNNI